MNKQQLILIFSALAIVAGLYFFGPTVAPSKPANTAKPGNSKATAEFDLAAYQQSAIAGLSEVRQQYVTGLEAAVKRGDVKNQAIHANHQLAAFWKDSVPNPILHFYFSSGAAELDNKEKSLTFAAHSILAYLPFAQSQPEQAWLANKGAELFKEALLLNPANDSSAVGLGGCIIYGANAGEGGPMQGIMKVREVAEKDSNNLFAQYMLGVGGVVSRQYDKAILRFERVVKGQPNNLEVLFKLAETCELMGDKTRAIHWYEVIAGKVREPQMKAELQKRIAELSK